MLKTDLVASEIYHGAIAHRVDGTPPDPWRLWRLLPSEARTALLEVVFAAERFVCLKRFADEYPGVLSTLDKRDAEVQLESAFRPFRHRRG
jgi:hypothetical protein